jgi:protein-tyrosine kinase
MVKFRDSEMPDAATRGAAGATDAGRPEYRDRAIGDLIAESRNLNADQVEKILTYQRSQGVRFGEAAVALGYASSEDVLSALAQQFHYPYATEERRNSSPELVTLNQPFSERAEAFRAIRSQLMMRVFTDASPRPALAVISPETRDGKSYFAANIAVTLAQLGGRTLLLDADMRGPRQHAVFNLPNNAGLSGILSGRTVDRVVQQVPGIASLFVLPVGATPPNPLELVERPAFGLLLRELTSKFDHVVVDTPAACYGTDCMVIASRCGAALLVAKRNASRVAALQELAAAVGDSGAKLAGVVMNEFQD